MKESEKIKWFLALVLVFTSLSCGLFRQDDDAIVANEQSKVQNVGINKEIEKLKKELSQAKDDHERATICQTISALASEKGNTALAHEFAQKSVKYQPNLFLARYLLGKAYMELGRYGDAEAEFRTSIELKKDYAPSHFELGNALYKKIQYDGAIREYSEAIRLDPSHYEAMNNIATISVDQRNFANAEKYLQNAIKVNPAFALAYKNLAILYETRLNNKALAVEYYTKYLRIMPNAPDRGRIKSWLRWLGGK
jgi:tetratricopeptide (TPR) repeat protein